MSNALENSRPSGGIIEGLARVLREIVRTPRHRENLHLVLRDFDPENASLLVDAVAEQDVELFLSLLSAAPALANLGVHGTATVLERLHGYAPGLAPPFAAGLLEDLDAHRAGEASALALALWAKIDRHDAGDAAQGFSAARDEFAAGFARGLEATGVSGAQLSDAVVAALLRRVGTAVSALNESLADNDSAASQAVENLVGGLQKIAAANPLVVEKVLRPLAELGRTAATNAGGRDDQ